MASRPKAPESADAAGRALWLAVTRVYELAPHEAELLRQAVRTVDVLARVDAILMDEDLVVPGYNGQPRAHPLLTVAADQRRLLVELVRSMALPLPGEEWGRIRSPQQQAAAQERWRERGVGL
jgi:hypothetical protein